MTRGQRKPFHQDARDVALLLREENGTWRRPGEDAAPRFRTLEEAQRWCTAGGAELVSGRRVAVVRILDMFQVEHVPKRIVRLMRPDPNTTQLSTSTRLAPSPEPDPLPDDNGLPAST